MRRDLQGLRAVAVLAVVAYHAGLPVPGGYAGVDAFYVLSGFLITGLLVRELQLTGRVDLPAFYARRARRLLPAAVLVLVATAVCSVLVLPPLQVRQTLTDVLAAALYVGNYRFALLAGLRRTVAAVRAAGATAVVLGPTALPSSDVPTCLSAHLHDATACTMAVASAVRRAGIAAERAATLAAGGRYVDVTPWTCTAVRCAVVEGNLLLYRDDNHLTTAYPRWLAPLLQEHVAAAVAGAPDPGAGAPVSPRAPGPQP